MNNEVTKELLFQTKRYWYSPLGLIIALGLTIAILAMLFSRVQLEQLSAPEILSGGAVCVIVVAVWAWTRRIPKAKKGTLGFVVALTAAVAIMVLFIGLNLRGVGEAGGVEIILVWFKLAVLVGLAGWGLARWNPH